MTLFELDQILEDKYKHCACLNESTVAKIIGVSPSTLGNYRNQATGPKWFSVGKGKRPRIMYSKTSILEFINDNEVKTL